MELTIQSALSMQGALGHSAYLLLVLSMLMRRMVLLRLLVIASAVVSVAYATLILSDPVSLFWETLLIAVNVGQLSLTWWRDRRTQFDAREAELYRRHFAQLSPGQMRDLLEQGTWTWLDAGTQLARRALAVDALHYLASGAARVELEGVVVGHCTAGGFIGELTVSSGEPAIADAVIAERALVWRLPATVLRELSRRRPEIGAALEAAFFRMIRTRLQDGNARLVAASPGCTEITGQTGVDPLSAGASADMAAGPGQQEALP